MTSPKSSHLPASRLRRIVSVVTIAVLGALCPTLLLTAEAASAATVPQGFQDNVTLSGLNLPTNVEFSNDGRVFVTEKRGVLKVFDSLTDPSADVVSDLRTEVNSYWDRGLLGLALDPQFPAQPYVYVSYTYDHKLGSATAAPLWGTANTDSDSCPEPQSSTTGCVVSARVSRLTLAGNTATNETVLVEDWCAMYPSHSIGDLAFGPDGALYVGGGDGASFTFGDTGQGIGGNQCNDPVGPTGVVEGGVLRSQDIETPNDPTALNGTIIRIDPLTGAGRAGNPYFDSPDVNKKRVIAYGLRNPYRFTFRPGTKELYTTDIGWGSVEEINRIDDVTAVTANKANNFGWPCYEGPSRQPSYENAGLAICTSLYSRPGAVTAPVLTYNHTDPVVNGDGCPSGSSAPTGIAFYSGTSYPAEYRGAMFFADFARQCIWSVSPDPLTGRPDPATTKLFASGAKSPVELETGPNGDLFYLEIIEGTLRRISYVGGNKAPVVSVSATKTSGLAPLTTTLTATATDPDNDPVTFAWDTNDDGIFDNGTGPTKIATYPTPGVFTPAVQGRDPSGATTIARAVVSVGTAQTQLPPPGASAWTVNGGAAFNACGVLLNPETTQFASANAWLNATVASSSITASFDAIIGPGTGADGMTFSMIDGSQPTSVNGGNGGQLGFGGLPGVAVTLDTYQGVGEPSANFVGVATSTTPGTLKYLVTNSAVPTLRNATTHVDVVVTAGRLRVFVAGSEVIDTNITLPPTVRIGFTSGTGGLADAHSACNVAVSTPPLTPGNLVPSTNFVDFGQVEVGRSANNSFTWRNSGQQPVVVGTVTPPTSPFQPTTALIAGSIIAPGQSVTQSIRFQPTALGAAKANFVVDPTGPQPPVTVALAGVGLQPTGPSAVITSPAPTFTWAVGDPVNFSGVASGATGQPLPASALTWRIIMHHCSSPTVCHEHIINDRPGASGSFLAPDHEFPSYLELKLTAVDGAQTTNTNVFIQPKATSLHLLSSPPGLKLVNGSNPQATAPIDTFANTNSQLTAAAPSPQVMGGITYEFAGWSDGGAASHTLTVPAAETTLTATYLPVGGNPARCGTSALPPLSAASWVVNGGASKHGVDVELTPTTQYVAGSVVSNQPVATEGLRICVDAFATGGTGADGMTVALIDPAQGPTALGDGGSALGFAGTPGIGGKSAAVALDTFPGAGEPGTDFLAIMKPGVAGYLAASAVGVPDQSLVGVPLDITVAGGVLTARIGTTIVTQAPVTLPPTVLVGFTAGNGAVSDQHVVRHVVINGSGTVTQAPPPVVTPPPPVVTPPVVTPPVVTPPKYTPFQIWVFLVLWAKAIEAEKKKCVLTRKKVGRKFVRVCVPRRVVATRRR